MRARSSSCVTGVFCCVFGSCEGRRLTDAVAWESHPRAAPRGGGGADGSSDGAGMMGRGRSGGCVCGGVGWGRIV